MSISANRKIHSNTAILNIVGWETSYPWQINLMFNGWGGSLFSHKKCKSHDLLKDTYVT